MSVFSQGFAAVVETGGVMLPILSLWPADITSMIVEFVGAEARALCAINKCAATANTLAPGQRMVMQGDWGLHKFKNYTSLSG
jgi:hypothetical protein